MKTIEISEDASQLSKWFDSTLPERFRRDQHAAKKREIEFQKLLNRGLSTQEIRKVCDWARHDEFWSRNFYSPAKLWKRQRSTDLRYWDVFCERMEENEDDYDFDPRFC